MHGQIATPGDILDRIVALLLALADLAERAAGAPDARRRLVLAILRRADSVASDFILTSSRASATPAPAGTSASGDGPADALALAMALRTLALLLRSMTGRTRRLSRLLADQAGKLFDGYALHRPLIAAISRPLDTPPDPARRLDTS